MNLLKKKSNKKNSAKVNPTTLCDGLKFTALEQYKILRSNLAFTIPEDVKCPIIGITSAMPGDCKSTTAINLAYVLAEDKKRVLLIDGDLRLSSIAKKMNISGKTGFTDYLTSKNSIQSIQTFKRGDKVMENFHIMPNGKLPPNPSEILSSARTGRFFDSVKASYDYIIVDLPPVNIVTDAVAISKYLTGMILVVREGHTEKKEFDRTARQLKQSGVNVLGCVLTDSKAGHGYYKKNYGYGYYGAARSSEKGSNK